MFNESSIKGFFGSKLFYKFKSVFDPCCGGISDKGDETKVLNQKGNWIVGGGDIQSLLSSLPVHDSAATALSNGVIYGSWFFNTLTNTVSKAWNFISRFSTGSSSIAFISDGSDGWNLLVDANPTTIQIPSGETIDSVHVEVLFWNAGSGTTIHDASITTDTTINTGANGAGAYEVSLTYNISDGSTFQTFALITTNATNSILKYYKYNGSSVSNVNGLDLTVTADINTDTTVGVQWAAFDGTTPTPIGNGEVANVTVLPNTIRIGTFFDLGSEFPDYPNPDYGVGFSIIIN